MDHFGRDFVLRLVTRKFESLRVDYKRALDLSESKHKQELVKDVSAQANALDVDETLATMKVSGITGCIIVGADENGNLYDISSLKLDDAKLQQIVNEHITPRIKFRFQPYDVKDASGMLIRIGAIIVERSARPPHKISKPYGKLRPGQCFVREGTSTREASEYDLERMYAHRLGLTPDQMDIRSLGAHLEAVRGDPEFARWSDRFYMRATASFLPLYACPFGFDADTCPKEDLVGLLHRHERLLVLGEGGIGKTTALERLALDYADLDTATSGQLLVPILVRLLSYNGSLLRAIQASLNQFGHLHLQNEHEVTQFLRTIDCVIMVDGLNETPGRWRDAICADILEFVNLFPQHKTIITSRLQDELWRQIHSEQIPAVVIQHLSTDDVRNYLIAHFGKAEGGRLFGALSESLRELARLPLILWLVENLASSGADLLLNSRGQLIAGFVQTIFKRERGKGLLASSIPSDVKHRCLSTLAYEMQKSRTLTAPITTVRKAFIRSLEQQQESFEWRTILSEIKRNSLLIGEDEVRFLHQMFQDFFAAAICKEQCDNGIWADLAQEGWWHDTLVLTCSIAEEPAAILHAVAKVNIPLAVQCLSEAKEIDPSTLQRIFSRLESQFSSLDEDTRLGVVRTVRRIPGDEATGFLVECLADPSPRVRDSAGYGLTIRGAGMVRYLFSVLCEFPPDIQQHILFVLSRSRAGIDLDPESMDKLLSLDVSGQKAFSYIVKIVRKMPPQALEVLTGLAESDTSARAFKALRVLARLDSEAAAVIAPRFFSHSDYQIRKAAALLIGRLKDTEAVDQLTSLLGDRNMSVRRAAVLALGRLADKRGVKPLIEILNDRDHVIRRRAAAALAWTGDLSAVEPLIEALHDKDSRVRTAAAESLGRLRDKRAIASLRQALYDDNETVHREAVIALWRMASIRVSKRTSQLMHEGNEAIIRQAAAIALGRLGEREVREELLEALGASAVLLRREAVRTLSILRDKRMVGRIVALLQDDNAGVRQEAARALGVLCDARAVEALIASLQDPVVKVRIAACVSLGYLGDSRAMEPLGALIHSDVDRNLRQSACIALGYLGDDRVIEPLIEIVNDSSRSGRHVRRPAIIGLGRIGDERAVNALTKALNDRDSGVRHAAVIALEKIDAPQAVEAIRKTMLQDKTPSVRKRAASALQRLTGRDRDLGS